MLKSEKPQLLERGIIKKILLCQLYYLYTTKN